jgi:K+-sensing histidine kinase KdpD
VGIPEEARALIFEKFTQLDSSVRREHEGIGLGLYLVRKFVDLLGGEVRVESEVGVGSAFEVRLPTDSEDASIMAQRQVKTMQRAQNRNNFEPHEPAKSARHFCREG